MRRRAKYKFDFFLTFQLAAADKNVINPLNTINGADNPSTPKDHSNPMDGNQVTLSTNCRELIVGSYFLNKTPIIKRKSKNKKVNEIFLGLELSSPSFDSKNGKIKAPTRGSNTIADSHGKEFKFIL